MGQLKRVSVPNDVPGNKGGGGPAFLCRAPVSLALVCACCVLPTIP